MCRLYEYLCYTIAAAETKGGAIGGLIFLTVRAAGQSGASSSKNWGFKDLIERVRG